MLRAVLACVGLAAFLAPALTAQNKVCVFQDKPGHIAHVSTSDADALAGELNSRSIQAVSAVGIPKNQEDAEGQKQGCTWIVTLWRQDLPADSPNYGGTLGGTQNANMSNAELDANKPTGGALLEFNLHKADSKKNVAHGESDEASPYAKIADQLLKKVGKDK
ncbi:MAG TPA: hypothetical protein VHX37_04840 [Acidobacteriaceae bacterium]|jgi:hypothetical protein|nr:hypothetical protein [Acidobacteriaceae bacterium]